jgi:hypothetical protein
MPSRFPQDDEVKTMTTLASAQRALRDMTLLKDERSSTLYASAIARVVRRITSAAA